MGAPHVHGRFASAMEALLGVPIFMLVPVIDPSGLSLASAAAQPALAIRYAALLFIITAGAIITVCLGAQKCAAATGATTLTTSSTVAGYLAQALFFGMKPSPLSLGGAAVMLAGVAVLGFAKDAEAEGEDAHAKDEGKLDNVADEAGCSAGSVDGQQAVEEHAEMSER